MLTTDVEAKDIRDAFFDDIYNFGKKDKDVVILTDDMDVFSLRKFKEEYPDRFINTGVAEQNMINVAAGLASCGKKVFVYGIAPFVTFRCYEQIKVSLCAMNLPVTIIGIGAGFSFGSDGPTHHAVHDIAAMRSLPNMTILNPSDGISSSACSHMSYYNMHNPIYVRMDKGKFPVVHDTYEDFNNGLKYVRRVGGDPRKVLIISSGLLVHTACQIADEYSNVGVVDVYRLHPINVDGLCHIIKQYDFIVTLEEHSITGGLGSIVSEVCVDQGIKLSIKRIALPEDHCFYYAQRKWLHDVYNLDKESVIQEIRSHSGVILSRV